MNSIRVGFALCGSYCTFQKVIPIIEQLKQQGADITPIMSENAYSTDTRFGKAQEHIQRIEKICDKKRLSF